MNPGRSLALGLVAAAQLWTALALGAVEKGPLLGDVTKDEVTIRWFTDQPSLGTVSYGTTPTALTQSSTEIAASTDHEVTLTGLTPATQYYYAITSGADLVQGPGLLFRTAPDPCTPFRYVVFGDTRGATPLCDNFTDWAKVSMMIAAQQPDFVVGTGDYVYAGVTPACWDHWFDQAGALLRRAPFFGVIGNHEYKTGKYSAEDDPGLLAYSRWFPMPAGPEVGKATTYFAFSYGNARFIVFDSFKDTSPGSDQLKWIESELALAKLSPDVQHVFVVTHATFEGAGSFCLLGDQVQKGIRANVEPLVEKYGVDATFVGHEHSYQRSFKAGVHHVVTGGGGSPLESIGGVGCNLPLCFSPKYLVKYESCRFHALVVDVAGTHVKYQAIAEDGVTLIDAWEEDRGGDKSPVCDSPDAGPPDAGPPDADVEPDAGDEPDSATAEPQPDAAPRKSDTAGDSGGCGCRQAGSRSAPAWWLLGAVCSSALARHRRARRSGRRVG